MHRTKPSGEILTKSSALAVHFFQCELLMFNW